MIITSGQLIGMNVKTKDGRPVGSVKGFELETDTMQIQKFIVAESGLVKKLLDGDLVIDRSQVIEINDQELIIESGAVAIGEPALT